METKVGRRCDRLRPMDEHDHRDHENDHENRKGHHRERCPGLSDPYRREEHHPWQNTPDAARK